MATLTLSIDSFSVTLKTFAPNGYERILAESSAVEYSLTGKAIETGNLYESKHVWTISSYVSANEWRMLQTIYQRSERNRRNQEDYGILIYDKIEPFVEDAAMRTRAIVPGESATALTGGAIAYPAIFEARLFEPKAERTRNSLYPYLARFVLRELDKVTP